MSRQIRLMVAVVLIAVMAIPTALAAMDYSKNVAVEGKVTVTASSSHGTEPAINVIKDDDNPWGHADPAGGPGNPIPNNPWVQIELNEPTMLNAVVIRTKVNTGTQALGQDMVISVKVEFDDGTVIEKSNLGYRGIAEPEYNEITFDAKLVKWVKVYPTDGVNLADANGAFRLGFSRILLLEATDTANSAVTEPETPAATAPPANNTSNANNTSVPDTSDSGLVAFILMGAAAAAGFVFLKRNK